LLAQIRLVLFVTAFMLVGGVAVAEDFKFRNGNTKKTEIESWLSVGVIVENKKDFYFYAEIESIDGRAMEKLGIYKALMVFWSSVKHWIKAPHFGVRKEFRIYDQNNELSRKPKEVCKNVTDVRLTNFYNGKGDVTARVTCARRKRESIKVYHEDGSLKWLLLFKNNKISGVTRYTPEGDHILVGDAPVSQ